MFIAAAMLFGLAAAAGAADTVKKIVFTPSVTEVSAGDTFTVTLSVDGFEGYNQIMAYDPVYDEDCLEWTGGEWLLTDTLMKDYIVESSIVDGKEQGRSIVCMTNSATDYSGGVATFEFKVLKDLADTESISFSVIVKADGEELSEGVTVTAAQVGPVVEEPAVTYTYGQNVQIRLVEPWGLKANIKVSANGSVVNYSSLYDYGVYFIRASQLATPGLTQTTITPEDIYNDSDAVIYTKGNGIVQEGQYIGATFSKDLYTYEFSDSVFVMYYIIPKEGDDPIYAPIRERNLSDLLNTRKDDTSGAFTETEREVYKYMTILERDITDYRSDFTNLAKSPDQKAPVLADYPLGNTAEVNSYTFSHNVQIRLIEPWGMKVNAKASLASTGKLVNYSSLKDYGVIILFDNTNDYSLEELIANKNAYVFSNKNGDSSLDGSYMTATYKKNLYTYQLNTNAYVVFYVEDEAGVHYGPLKVRNLYDLMTTRAVDTTGSFTEKEKTVYADMVNLYDAVTVYRSDFLN